MRIGTDWNHYGYIYGDEGRRAQIRFDVERALMPAPDTHQHNVRVSIHGAVEDGFERRLAELLQGVDCWLVGVLRYHDVTAFVLQVEDRAGFSGREAAVVDCVPATVTLERSDGWGFFDERVCPNDADWQRITDREQLEQLRGAGVEVAAELAVAHAFFGPVAQLQHIVETLTPDGFEVVSLEGDRLVVTRVHSLLEVSRISVPLATFSRARGVLYDGWKLV